MATCLLLLAVPLTAQEGLLVGFRSSQRTVWIVRDSQGARVAAALPELMVHRNNGFWRVGKTEICEFNAGEREENTREVLWIAPAEKSPTIALQAMCGQLRAQRTQLAAHSLLPSEGPEDSQSDIKLCRYEDAVVSFVSPDYIARARIDGRHDDCVGPQGWDRYRVNAWVQKLDDPAPVDLRNVLGDRTPELYEAALKQAYAQQKRDGMSCPNLFEDDTTSWSIGRARGRWRPLAEEGGAGCEVSYPMDVTLPAAIVGAEPQCPDWAMLAKNIPHLDDAFCSPAGDLLVAVSDTRESTGDGTLAIFELTKSGLGKQVFSVSTGGNPIAMIQWATGSDVQLWTDQLVKFEKRGLPRPIFQSSRH